eukprot:TRINITY_DN15011_c0_g1_i1.p1 TRINITY_DN15011_c0_g1~~TRINITY_DN15011_c0_g1_i1.p1  ORF type:complete len:475 (-),score=87.72 TRINITY_DN15011_c0_g1_i1:306-1730(-)
MKRFLPQGIVLLLAQGGWSTELDEARRAEDAAAEASELACEDESTRDIGLGLLQKSLERPSRRPPLPPPAQVLELRQQRAALLQELDSIDADLAQSSATKESEAEVKAEAARGTKCPGSRSWIHASCKVTVSVASPCADVAAEILARASHDQGWVDPHNGGHYTILSHTATEINTERTTNPKTSVGGKVYTDKQTLTLIESSDHAACLVKGCSESQGFSVKDFSTNYCNLRNLYCGPEDGCKPVLHTFNTKETSVKASSGAGTDASQCILATNPFSPSSASSEAPSANTSSTGLLAISAEEFQGVAKALASHMRLRAAGADPTLALVLVLVIFVGAVITFACCSLHHYFGSLSSLHVRKSLGLAPSMGQDNVIGMKPNSWMIVYSYGPGAVRYCAYQNEEQARGDYNSFNPVIPRILFDRHHNEVCHHGVNFYVNDRLRAASRKDEGKMVPGQWMVLLGRGIFGSDRINYCSFT